MATSALPDEIDYSHHVAQLGADDWDTRAASADLLARSGTKSLDALVQGTMHPNWRVRRGCADLMDHLADDRCTQALVRLLADPVIAVRRLAVHALSCQRCKVCALDVDVISYLIACAQTDSSIRVRRVAVHQLGCQTPDPRAISALRNIINQETDTGLLSRAQWALSQQTHDLKT